MIDPMLPLPGLSRVGGKSVVACFDGGLLSSDAGILAVCEVEQLFDGAASWSRVECPCGGMVGQ